MKAEELQVRPVDTDALVAFLKSEMPLADNQTYYIEKVAVVSNDVVTDNECCYEIIERRFNKGQIDYVYPIGCRIKTYNNDGSYSMPMTTAFYYDISLRDLEKYMKAPISLKDFMVGRYNYNPRIETNTREFLKFISECLSAKTEA